VERGGQYVPAKNPCLGCSNTRDRSRRHDIRDALQRNETREDCGEIGQAAPALVPGHHPGFAITFTLATLSVATLSVLIGIVAPSSRAATMLSQLVYLPSVLLGGLMVPEELLPEAVARGASLVPATQAMRAFNTLAFAGGPFATAAGPLLVLAASVAVGVFLG